MNVGRSNDAERGQELLLRYGMNPDQTPARVYVEHGSLPLVVRSGAPSYINLLDALNAWRLVQELSAATTLPAAASFKHTAPAGAAVGLPLTPTLARAYRVSPEFLSPLAAAYARARGADRIASYGDFVAISEPMDESTAAYLAKEASDGVIAPGYAPDALDRLRRKKGGKYLVLEIDAAWQPEPIERRHVFGVTFEQPRNHAPVELGTVVSQRTDLSVSARRDLQIAAITLKYTPSNSICLAINGQVVGVGAGQQSRIHCTRLACSKAEV
jgi:phosphoribosylaminoimidazolecarboxamide formyltransferase / IMP cyclohydrolase